MSNLYTTDDQMWVPEYPPEDVDGGDSGSVREASVDTDGSGE